MKQRSIFEKHGRLGTTSDLFERDCKLKEIIPLGIEFCRILCNIRLENINKRWTILFAYFW